MKLKKWQLNLITLSLFVFSIHAFAADEMEISEKETPQKTRINLIGGYSLISRSTGGTGLNSANIEGGFQYALSKKIGIIGGVKQGVSVSTLNNLYTEFEFGAIYAITGSLYKLSKIAVLDGKEVAQSSGFYEGGFRAELGVAQYLFNGKASSVPYSGFGAGIGYDMPSSSAVTYGIVIRDDQLSNSKITIQALQFGIKFGFFLE